MAKTQNKGVQASTPPADTPPADTPPADTPPVDTPPVDTPPVDTPPVDTPPVDTALSESAPKQHKFSKTVGHKSKIYEAGQSYPLPDEDAQALAHFIEQ